MVQVEVVRRQRQAVRRRKRNLVYTGLQAFRLDNRCSHLRQVALNPTILHLYAKLSMNRNHRVLVRKTEVPSKKKYTKRSRNVMGHVHVGVVRQYSSI